MVANDGDGVPAALAKGVAFGLGVYALSYAGWIPALDILPPSHRDRRDRQASIALSHAVYGAVLGALARR